MGQSKLTVFKAFIQTAHLQGWRKVRFEDKLFGKPRRGCGPSGGREPTNTFSEHCPSLAWPLLTPLALPLPPARSGFF